MHYELKQIDGEWVRQEKEPEKAWVTEEVTRTTYNLLGLVFIEKEGYDGLVLTLDEIPLMNQRHGKPQYCSLNLQVDNVDTKFPCPQIHGLFYDENGNYRFVHCFSDIYKITS